MDIDYAVDDQGELSPEDQEKVRVFGRLASALIITAWVSTGLFIGATVVATIMACIGYWRRQYIRRRVKDGYLNALNIGSKVATVTTTTVSETNIKQS